jgi:hypothetical protein
MPFPPEAFIIGAQRAGTTSLCAVLSQHPNIVPSTPKEPNFFSGNWELGLDWYNSCFRRFDATLIDASVSYTMATSATIADDLPDTIPRRIYEVSPQAKFVYLVRDPVERCYSAYWHEVRAGREKHPLREAIDRSPDYVMASSYYRQIKPFLRVFSLDRFCFVRFEDFVRDPLIAAQNCAAFFGVECSNFVFRPEKPLNQAFQYSLLGRGLRRLAGNEGMKVLSSAVSGILPGSLHSYAKRTITRTIPPLSPADRMWLAPRFAEDACVFGQLSGARVLHTTGTTTRLDRS